MPRPTYTDEFKAEAVALAIQHGAAAAARQVDVNAGTIRSWMSRTPGVATDVHRTIEDARETARQRREAAREELRTLLVTKAVDLVKRMDEEHVDYRGKDADQVSFPKAPPQACQQYATAAAILLDKFRLEMGEATGRTEHTGETREAAKHVADEIAARRASKAA